MALAKDEEGPGPVADAQTATNTKEKRRRNLRVKKRSRDSDESGDDQRQAQATAMPSQNPKGRAAAMTFTTRDLNDADKKGFHTFESSGIQASARQDDATRTIEDIGVRRLGGAGLDHADRPDDDDGGGGGGGGGGGDAGLDGDAGTNTYRGMQGYTDYRQNFRGEAERAGANISERKQQAGPARPSANYRMTVLVDYQPDVCKDYKETGFCGFGDSCKFLHDRSDYKAGWQLDRDWNAAQKAKKERENGLKIVGDEEQDEPRPGDDLPFACLICKVPWESPSCADPVVTKCGHYFCETCALRQNSKAGKCFACGKSTRGIFNTASEIIKRFKKG